MDDAIASLTSAMWSVCIVCVCCHSVCVGGTVCLFPRACLGTTNCCVAGWHQVSQGWAESWKRRHRLAESPSPSRSRLFSQWALTYGQIQPPQHWHTKQLLADPALKYSCKKQLVISYTVPYGALLSGGKRSWNSYRTSQGPISNLLPSNNPVRSCSQERRESLELEPRQEAERIRPYHVKARGGRLLEKAIKSPSKEQY